MAFETQKDFFQLGFLDKQLNPRCSRQAAVTKLKTFASSTDTRSFDMNKKTQSNFLSDLVACRTYSEEKRDYTKNDNDFTFPGISGDVHVSRTPQTIKEFSEKVQDINDGLLKNIISKTTKDSANDSKCFLLNEKIRTLREENKITQKDATELSEISKNLCTTIDELQTKILSKNSIDEQTYNRLLAERNSLKDQLTKMPGYKENVELKEKTIEANDSKCFLLNEKIRTLREENKITQKDATELSEISKKICIKIEELQKKITSKNCIDEQAYNRLLAERNILHDQLNKNIKKIEEIPMEGNSLNDENEKLKNTISNPSKDSKCFLLNQKIKTLSEHNKITQTDTKELLSLSNDLCIAFEKLQNKISSKNCIDEELYNRLLAERNSLKDQLNKKSGYEEHIEKLRERAMEADRLETELNDFKRNINDFRQGSKEVFNKLNNEKKTLEYQLGDINRIQNENEELRKYLQCFDNLKLENKELIDELRNTACQLQRMRCVEQELIVTKHQLCRNERIIQDYECQFHQLMDVIEELEDDRISPYDTNDDNHCKGSNSKSLVKDVHLENLVVATRATLQQMKLELKARNILEEELEDSKHELEIIKYKSDIAAENLEIVEAENSILKKDLQEMRNEKSGKINIIESNLTKSQEALHKQQEILLKQDNALKEHRDLLISAKEDLQRKQLTTQKSKEQILTLEDDNVSLQRNNETLVKKLKENENEIQSLNNKCIQLENELKNCQAKLELTRNNSKHELTSNLEEVANLKKSLENCNEQLAKKEEIINSLIKEKEALDAAAKKNLNNLKQMENIVGDIESEQVKNLKLDEMVNDFDKKLENVSQLGQIPPAQTKKDVETVQTATNKLKHQLEKEEFKGNKLTKKIRQSKAGVASEIKKQTQVLEKKNGQNLLKLQNIHDEQMKSVKKCHEQEVSALKCCNNVLREKGKVCDSCRCRINEHSSGEITKLQKICRKVIDYGIDCLKLTELTYLHKVVYDAGLKLKPELLQSLSNAQKCCKCNGFSCCLPNIAKGVEKKLLLRIQNLEKALENSNEDVKYLKSLEKAKNMKSPCETAKYNYSDKDVTNLTNLLGMYCDSVRTKKSKSRLSKFFEDDRQCKSACQKSQRSRYCDVPTRD